LLSSPSDIDVDALGFIYVANRGNNAVLVFRTSAA
jgi:DNA-binding beta-propeller fold protein YncE